MIGLKVNTDHDTIAFPRFPGVHRCSLTASMVLPGTGDPAVLLRRRLRAERSCSRGMWTENSIRNLATLSEASRHRASRVLPETSLPLATAVRTSSRWGERLG